MEECAPMSTLMTKNYKLNKDDDSPPVDATLYMSIIGSLLYLTAIRPDIMQMLQNILSHLLHFLATYLKVPET